MPNTKWSELSSLQLGRYAEYYAKMEMTSYGFEVYTSEVDDHGVDFIAKRVHSSKYYEIQVKSIRNSGYVFLPKSKWDVDKENLILVLLMFQEGRIPNVFMIPSNAWKKPNELFKVREYDGLKSNPEYGLNLSLKNQSILERFSIENIMNELD